MATLSRAVTINITLVIAMLVLGAALGSSRGRFMKEIHRLEAQTEQRITEARPANLVSSGAALVAVFFAWRSFTGYRRRVEG